MLEKLEMPKKRFQKASPASQASPASLAFLYYAKNQKTEGRD